MGVGVGVGISDLLNLNLRGFNRFLTPSGQAIQSNLWGLMLTQRVLGSSGSYSDPETQGSRGCRCIPECSDILVL